MSYSRWSNSHWYTFHCVQPCNVEETKDNAIFEVCGVHQFSAKELREDLKGCIDIVKKLDGSATNADFDELKGYMEMFIKNIDSGYLESKSIY